MGFLTSRLGKANFQPHRPLSFPVAPITCQTESSKELKSALVLVFDWCQVQHKPLWRTVTYLHRNDCTSSQQGGWGDREWHTVKSFWSSCMFSPWHERVTKNLLIYFLVFYFGQEAELQESWFWEEMALPACIPQGVTLQVQKAHGISQHILWTLSQVLETLPVLSGIFLLKWSSCNQSSRFLPEEEVRQQLVLKSCELKV